MKTAFVLAASVLALFNGFAAAAPTEETQVAARQEEWGINPGHDGIDYPGGDNCPRISFAGCPSGYTLAWSYKNDCPFPTCIVDECTGQSFDPETVCLLYIITGCKNGQTLVPTCPCRNNACKDTSSLTYAPGFQGR
jgi:hypothetical protein